MDMKNYDAKLLFRDKMNIKLSFLNELIKRGPEYDEDVKKVVESLMKDLDIE